MNIKKKVTSVALASIFAAVSATTMAFATNPVNLHYHNAANPSANHISDTVDITPIRCTYNGHYGYQCYAHCTDISGTAPSGVYVNTDLYVNYSYVSNATITQGGKHGTYRTSKPYNSYAPVALAGSYHNIATYATICSCTEF